MGSGAALSLLTAVRIPATSAQRETGEQASSGRPRFAGSGRSRRGLGLAARASATAVGQRGLWCPQATRPVPAARGWLLQSPARAVCSVPVPVLVPVLVKVLVPVLVKVLVPLVER